MEVNPDDALGALGKDAYERHKQRARERQAQITRQGQDLGSIPPPADPERRERGRRDFRAFCETYQRHRFPLAWSPNHLRVIGIIERTVLDGGCFAYAMPRGSGKTTLVESSFVWAPLYGHRLFELLLAVTKDAAADLLQSVKFEFEYNPLLLADFPEVCLPIRALNGQANKCKGQHVGGAPTRMKWGRHEVVLPTIAGSAASGIIIRAAGLLGRIRGMKADPPVDENGPTREPPRPDLVAIDDPQTDETAGSDALKTKRLKAITSTVTGLAGPGKKIAAFMPCTVIECDDVADQLLDRTKNPDWQGLKLRALDAMPSNLELWEQYWEMRSDDLIAEKGVARSNKFYADNRAAMDEGAVATWPERFEPDEISAVQSAMNVYLAKPFKFAAELQNEPLRDAETSTALTADDVRSRVNGVGRRIVPTDAQYLTAFTDVHGDLLFWMVCAWRQDFTGWVIDYGAYPEQANKQRFTLRKARPKLGDKHGGGVLEAALAGGLGTIAEDLLPKAWKRVDADDLRIELMPIDAHWGDSTDTVKLFCRTSPFASQLIPSFGTFFAATSNPISAKKPKPEDRTGPEWVIPKAKRHLTFDSNHWKSFVAARLRVPVGAPSAITLFGDRPDKHDLLASHLTAEFPKPVKSGKREIDEWKLRTGRDNHWWDCLIGCAVAASTLGVRLTEAHAAKKKRKVVSFAEQQRLAKERRDQKKSA